MVGTTRMDRGWWRYYFTTHHFLRGERAEQLFTAFACNDNSHPDTIGIYNEYSNVTEYSIGWRNNLRWTAKLTVRPIRDCRLSMRVSVMPLQRSSND